MAGLLAGHVAAVTGGGSGIGQGICEAYAREGARVIVLDTNMDAARETVDLVSAAGGEGAAVKLDVTDREACRAAAAEIAKGGNISILVNNVPQTWSGVELEDKILHTLAAWDQPL